eukprot:gene18838-biopygen17448
MPAPRPRQCPVGSPRRASHSLSGRLFHFYRICLEIYLRTFLVHLFALCCSVVLGQPSVALDTRPGPTFDGPAGGLNSQSQTAGKCTNSVAGTTKLNGPAPNCAKKAPENENPAPKAPGSSPEFSRRQAGGRVSGRVVTGSWRGRDVDVTRAAQHSLDGVLKAVATLLLH